MRKLFSTRVEVIVGAVAAAAVVGVLAVYGGPGIGIAQAADAIKDGAQAMRDAAFGKSAGGSCPFSAKAAAEERSCGASGLAAAFAKEVGPACPSKAAAAKAAATPACDGDGKCDKDKAGVTAAVASATSACDGDGKCDKDKTTAGVTAAVASATPACDGDGGCDKDKKSGSAAAPTGHEAVLALLASDHQCDHEGACALRDVQAHTAAVKAAGLGCCGPAAPAKDAAPVAGETIVAQAQ